MKETYYFSHDYNARNDPKLQKLLMKYGQEGKGIYWDLIEMLYEQNGSLAISEIESYAFALRADKNVLQGIVYDLKLFEFDDDKFWSKSVLDRLQKRVEKSEKASNSANIRWNNAVALPSHSDSNAIKESKVKKIKINKNKVRDDVFLFDEEYKKLVDSYGVTFIDKCLDKLNNYKGASGKKYKSDYKAILSWVIDEVNKGVKNGTNKNNSPRGSIDFDKYAAEREASKPRGHPELVSDTVPKQLQ